MDESNAAALRQLTHKHAEESWGYLRQHLPGIRFRPTERASLLTVTIPVGEEFLTRNVSKDILLDPHKTREFFADSVDRREEYEAKLVAYGVVDDVLFGPVEPA